MNPESYATTGQRLLGLMSRWILTAVSVWVSTKVVPGVDYADWASLLAAALILGVLNTLVKPLLVAVALPLVVLSLGVMLLVINAFLLLMTSKLVPGFHVSGMWAAIGASLIISLVSIVLGKPSRRFASAQPRFRKSNVFKEPEPTRAPPPGKGPIIDV